MNPSSVHSQPSPCPLVPLSSSYPLRTELLSAFLVTTWDCWEFFKSPGQKTGKFLKRLGFLLVATDLLWSLRQVTSLLWASATLCTESSEGKMLPEVLFTH